MFWCVGFFFDFKVGIFEQYKGLFGAKKDGDDDEQIDDDDEDDEPSFNKKWGWIAIIFKLSDEKIYNKKIVEESNFMEILNWLSMQIEKNIEEKNAAK